MDIEAVKVSSKIGKMLKKPVPEVVLDLYLVLILIPKLNIYSANSLNYWPARPLTRNNAAALARARKRKHCEVLFCHIKRLCLK